MKQNFAEPIPVYTQSGELVSMKQAKLIMPDKRGHSMLKIGSSQDVVGILRQIPLLNESMLIREVFITLCLNRYNMVIGAFTVSIGGRTGTVVDASLVAFVAVNSLATGIILCHNHPSGSLEPSQADLSLTQKIKDGTKLLDIQLLDHIIITEASYFSFADEGKL